MAFVLAPALPPAKAESSASSSSVSSVPLPTREFRGAWIATVANLDWPSKPGLTSEQQKAELITLMNKAVELNLNVLILQVRPACDAFYASSLEPWSEFLTGRMGQAPQPFYDPLAFAVEQAHRRGLELHAWFNPFRVRLPTLKNPVAPNYVTRTHPSWVRNYGSQLWLDPGLPEVTAYAKRVILDVVKRYDIDGVHLDDYFYPYPEKDAKGQWIDFPDFATWRKSGSKLERGEWRRRNTDGLVDELYRRVKAEKRWVKFGVSPFGIWRPGFPRPIKGLDAYDRLYADARKWLANGWVDYLAPQLYWDIEGPDHSYSALLTWWAAQNPKHRHLWPGNDLTKVGGPWRSTEILRQIDFTRRQGGASGNLLLGMGALLRNQDHLTDRLRDLYAQPALVPSSPWLEQPAPAQPKLEVKASGGSGSFVLSWSNGGREKAWLWVFQARRNHEWTESILPADRASVWLSNSKTTPFPDAVAVTPIGRCGQAGPTAFLAPTEQLAGRSAR